VSPKGEALKSIRGEVATIETIINALGSLAADDPRYLMQVIDARDAAKRIDSTLKTMIRKSEAMCEFQGCRHLAEQVHRAKYSGRVRYCAEHSDRSALPLVGPFHPGEE
jgi:hypothetical protein